MSKLNKTSPEGSTAERTRFLERAVGLAEATPSAVTLLLAAGLKRFAVTNSSIR